MLNVQPFNFHLTQCITSGLKGIKNKFIFVLNEKKIYFVPEKKPFVIVEKKNQKFCGERLLNFFFASQKNSKKII